jgi:hypothetical protein
MSEKRMYERVAAHDPVGCWVDDRNQKGNFITAILHDITKKGAGLYILKKIRAGDKIIIRLNMPYEQVIADVRWVKKEQGDIYNAGIMFADPVL